MAKCITYITLYYASNEAGTKNEFYEKIYPGTTELPYAVRVNKPNSISEKAVGFNVTVPCEITIEGGYHGSGKKQALYEEETMKKSGLYWYRVYLVKEFSGSDAVKQAMTLEKTISKQLERSAYMLSEQYKGK